MVQMKKMIEIDAPVARVFGFVSNPENLPEVWPSLLEVSNLQRRADGTHGYDWVYKMAGIRFTGHGELTEIEPNRMHVTRNEAGIPSTFRYTYEDLEGNRTRLTIEVEYSIPGQLLSKLAEPIVRRINEHEADALMSNLKARMEHEEAREAAAEARPPAE